MTAGWRISLWVAVVLAAIGFLYLVRGILLPFVVAFVIASLLEPLIHKLRLRGFSRKWAVLTVVLPIYLAAIAGIVLLIPRVTTQIFNLNTRVDEFANSLAQASEKDSYFLRWNPEIQVEEENGIDGTIDRFLQQLPLSKLGLPSSRREIVQRYIAPRRPQIAAAVKQGFESFFGFLAGFAHNLLGLIVVFIVPWALLLEMEEMKRRAPRYIPPAIRASTIGLLTDIGHVFTKYLRGVATVMLLYAAAASILLTLLGVPYSILLGVLFAALYMIPLLGNLLVYLIVFSTVGLTGTSGTFFMHMASPWTYAIVVTLIYIVMGVIFDQLLYPTLVGSAVGLNTVTSIFVIFSGGALFGLVGMIIAFPLAGAVKIILDRLLRLTSSSAEQLSLPALPLRHRRTADA